MASPTQWTWVWVDSGVGDGQGGLASCSSWGYKESDMTQLKGRKVHPSSGPCDHSENENASLVAQRVESACKAVSSLGWEDPLEKGMATHSHILAWKIPWTDEPGGATVHGVAKIHTRMSD